MSTAQAATRTRPRLFRFGFVAVHVDSPAEAAAAVTVLDDALEALEAAGLQRPALITHVRTAVAHLKAPGHVALMAVHGTAIRLAATDYLMRHPDGIEIHGLATALADRCSEAHA